MDGDGNEHMRSYNSLDDLVMETFTMLAPEAAFQMRLQRKQEAAGKSASQAGAIKDRVTSTYKTLADEMALQWGQMTPEQRAQAVRERIAAEDAIAASLLPQGSAGATPSAGGQGAPTRGALPDEGRNILRPN